MMRVVLAIVLFLPVAAWGQMPSQGASVAVNASELSPEINLGSPLLEGSPGPGAHIDKAGTSFSSTLSRGFVPERSSLSSSYDVSSADTVRFVAPAWGMEPNNNKWHTLDRTFIVFSLFSTLAAIGDIETTARGMKISPAATELNPLFGPHPTRGRLYGVGMPMNLLLISWSYHYKNLAPRRNTWKTILKMSIITHSAAAVNNLIVVR